MYKLTFEKRVWIVKQVLRGTPQNKAALAQSVSTRTVRELMQNYRHYGGDGLKDHKRAVRNRPKPNCCTNYS